MLRLVKVTQVDRKKYPDAILKNIERNMISNDINSSLEILLHIWKMAGKHLLLKRNCGMTIPLVIGLS